MTRAEAKEYHRKHDKSGKSRKMFRRKPKSDVTVYEGGAPGLRQQKKRR